MEKVLDKVFEWATTAGIRLVVALVVLLISFQIINAIGRHFLKRFSDAKKMDKTIGRTLVNVGTVAAKILVVICLVGYLGINTSGLTALVASLGVCAGLAVNGALSNFAGGVLLLVTRPFKVDDYIKVNDFEGTVEDIHIINTKIVTLDNRVVYIPNSIASSAVVVNFSEKDIRRVDFEFSISYNDDYNRALEILRDVLNGIDTVLDTPKPTLEVASYDSSSVKLYCRPWTRSANYWATYFAVMERVKKAFDENGISIPYDQLDVHVKND